MHYDNILECAGNTPLVRIRRLNPHKGVNILAKVEYFNPGGSIKDRVALAMLEAAERSGELVPGRTVIEPTSGNTGIGLAMACAVKGYRLRLIMADNVSEERKRILRAYGAEIELTEGRLGTDGAIELAYRMAREHPDEYVLMDQYNNPASIQAHFEGTAREIWEQTDGRVTHVVAALGTSGTAMGLVKRLKRENPDICVAAVEPYARHHIQGLKNMQESYPPGIFNKHLLDRIIRVEDEEAFEYCRRLAREEGLLVGMSSGAALAGAVHLAAELEQGTVVVIFPDSGERYLSTSLFATPDEQGVHLASATGDDVVLPCTGSVRLYTVGPSLDRWDDPDFWRRLAFLDVMRRYLGLRGADATLAAGLPDMDDRAMAASRDAHLSRSDFAREVRDMVAARAAQLDMGDVALSLAGDGREDILALCGGLLGSGLAYEKLRSVYFDVSRDGDYGRLGQADLDKLSLGKTVDLADYVKGNPQDFTLLKRASLRDLKDGECWQTCWGNVRPSWFVQMAAAARAAGGVPTVFMGGESHRFPHLENLRSIWTASDGASPRAWLLASPVVAADRDSHSRMSVGALLDEGFCPQTLRMWLLSAAYRKTLDFSTQTLSMWDSNRRRVQELAAALSARAGREGAAEGGVAEMKVNLRAAFREAIERDLALYSFWPELFGFCRGIRRHALDGALAPGEARACLDQLMAVDDVLRILDREALPVPPCEWPAEVASLVEARSAARAARDFARADALRDEMHAAGYVVEDDREGARLLRVRRD
ncbi:cysteinyl-tRNA synthetase [Desulfobaculum xiamenense]|uniref:cysteine synthase n=1 Tax=Desulfobaculum xiamenense TaxID=995050 RepID=A0A846QPS8_9BACT|nr:cysteine synthase [Desulfobaculum xiamenense]NJB67415.1 cysteinyl-tRNA synthetase [Desulfobaculum xiamenense]